MSILLAHQLSPKMQLALKRERREKMAKAELSLIRIQSILGLSDEELVRAAKRVTELDSLDPLAPPPKQP